MTSRRRSGRRAPCTSRHRASARSACRLRSWNSSKITRPTPESSGSPCRRRVRMPSVSTSRRVAAPTADSKRTRYPTVCPTGSPSVSASRAATARAATRRGCSISTPCPTSHPSCSSWSGRAVLLPAPGGACSTTSGCCARVARRSGSRSRTGRLTPGSLERLPGGRGCAGHPPSPRQYSMRSVLDVHARNACKLSSRPSCVMGRARWALGLSSSS